MSRDQDEQTMLDNLEAAARQLDTEGRGELTQEELFTAINQMDQLQISQDEVCEKKA
jgi:hypothetical protein